MTLIEALDEARFVDMTIPVGTHPLVRAVARWMQETPALAKELYEAAGLHPPLIFRGEYLETRKPEPEPETLTRVLNAVGPVGFHHKGVPVRVYALLSDGHPYTLLEITETLGVRKGSVLTAIARWRKKGIYIDFTRPSGTGKSTGAYVLRKLEAA